MANIANIVQNGIAVPIYLVDAATGLPISSTLPSSINIAQIGGIAPTMASGDSVTPANIQEFASGLYNGSVIVRARDVVAQGNGAFGTGITAAGVWLYNGSSWDKGVSNIDTAALISASGATTTQTSPDQTNYNARGVIVVLNMTVVGTGSVTLSIRGKDAASGAYYTLLAGAAVTTNSTNVYTVYPGAPATANVSANSPLPRTWNIQVVANNANATTYTVGASIIV